MINDLTPEQLAARSQAGCRESFEALVAQMGPRLLHYLNRFVGDHHEAEDLVQETFVKAYQSIDRFDPARARFSTWLFTIAKRAALSYLRSRRPISQTLPAPASVAETEAEAARPDLTCQRADDLSSVWTLAKRLKPEHYELLWLRYHEDFSVAEAATILGISQIRAKVSLHRARERLLRWLEPHSRD